MTMHVGIRIPSAGPLAGPESLVAVARAAEELGYDSVWATEHLVLPDQYAATYAYTASGRSWWTPDSPHLEVFTALSWVAAHTERLRIGTSVVVLPYRNPVVLAKSVATLDVLSGGRFVFGVGIGWLEAEFAAVSVPFKERVSRSVESLQVIRALLKEERPVHESRHFSFGGDVGFAPKPVQRPWPPIWVGGESRGALERAADYGDGWHPGGLTPGELRPKLAELARICEERGRDVHELEISLRVLPGRPFEDEHLDELHDLGVRHVILDPAYTHDSLDGYLREVHAYARIVEAARQFEPTGAA